MHKQQQQQEGINDVKNRSIRSRIVKALAGDNG